MTAKFKVGDNDNLQFILTTLAQGVQITLPSNISPIVYVHQFKDDSWETLTQQAKEATKNTCGMCGNNRIPLPIHHIWFLQTLLGVIALCGSCHSIIHHPNNSLINYIKRRATTAKFKIGDKVRFVTDNPKKRPAQFNLTDYRRRSRAIIGAYYFPDNKCTYYELSGIPRSFGLFRSYSLKLVTPKESLTRGTPRQKRKYTRRKVSV